jgi:PD-(D/E)XK endonuclease
LYSGARISIIRPLEIRLSNGEVSGAPSSATPATNQRQALPPKRRGGIAELAFMQKAVTLGFGVAKPWGDSDRYDYILDAGIKALQAAV